MGRFIASSQIEGQQSNDLVKFYNAIINCSSFDQLRNSTKGDLGLKKFIGILPIEEDNTLSSFWTKVYALPESEKHAFTMVAIALFSEVMAEKIRAQKLIFSYESISSRESNSQLRSFQQTADDSISFAERNNRSLEILFETCPLSSRTQKKERISYQCDCSCLLNYPSVSILVKQYIQRLMLMEDITEIDTRLFKVLCEKSKIHELLGLSLEELFSWLFYRQGNYIQRVEIKDFYCIQDIKMDFGDSKEIYFLGANGDGKTLLLDALYLAFNGNYVNKLSSEDVGAAQDMLKGGLSILKGWDEKEAEYCVRESAQLQNFFAYGVHRGRYDSMTANSAEKYGFMTLFSINKTLINPSEWIEKVCFRELMRSGSEQVSTKGIGQQTTKRMEQLQGIFDEVLDRKVTVYYDEEKECIMYEEEGARLKFDVLSEGYRSTIIFMCDLLYRLYQNNPESVFGQRDTPGVVLVDEIDSHLHPKWQRGIVKHLRKLFKNIQFIFTTHSPAIIQGASNDTDENGDAVIFRVYRENGKTCVSDPYKRSELNFMMLNTLFTSPLFGLEDALLGDSKGSTSKPYLMYEIEKRVRKEIDFEDARKYLSPKKIQELIDTATENVISETKKGHKS